MIGNGHAGFGRAASEKDPRAPRRRRTSTEVLRRPSVKAALDRVSGVVLIGLGVRIALEHR